MLEPRQLYNRLRSPNRQSQADIDSTIAKSENFKLMMRTQGWKDLEEWMSKTKQGASSMLEVESRNINAIGLLSFFNKFVQYMWIVAEVRAYNRIKLYLTTTIGKGEEYARRRARTEVKRKEKAS